jgi:DNA (cytosine-5)-methyltransferase 1
LLPTPAAGNFNDGESAEQWLKRQAAVRERLNNGNGMGMPLAATREMLPTPRATDGTKGGPNQRGSSGDLMLPSAVVNL